MTTTTAQVIGLWLDTTSDSDNPSWIVSRDEMNSKGQAESTVTHDCYSEDEYETALADAKALADKHGLCVIETGDESQACIYQPDGAVNPLV